MKKLALSLGLSLLALSVYSCKTNKTHRKVVNMRIPIIELNYQVDILDTTGFEVVNAQVIKEVLVLDIRHAGYTFDLYTTGMINKSMPPQRQLVLKRKYNEDDQSLALDRFQFDLKTLRVGEQGSVVLNLSKYPKPIIYTY